MTEATSDDVKGFLNAGLETVLDVKEFNRRANGIREGVFYDILDLASKRGIDWTRDISLCSGLVVSYSAEVPIKNSQGDEMVAPLLFYTTVDGDSPPGAWFRGYLSLGSRNGPSVSMHDERVRRLAVDEFGIDPEPY